MIYKGLKKILIGLCTSLICCASLPLLGDGGYSTCCYEPYACSDQFWVDAEYLYWQMKNSPEPVVLVAEASLSDPTAITPVIGGKSVQNGWRSGGKFALGYWFDETCHYGIEANYLILPKTSKTKTVSSDGSAGTPIILAPYIDAITGETVLNNYIAFPDFFAGTATRKTNNWMQGAELNGLAVFPCDYCVTFSALIGFRYWNFDENLKLLTSSPNFRGVPGVYHALDQFDVQNNFYGGQIGAGVEYKCDCFSVNAKVKVALGAMCEQLAINGVTFTNAFNGFTAVQEFPGAFFALPTSIGHYKKTNFAVIPEASVNFGYQVTEYLSVKLGYTFLYVSNMLWAGNQIDPVINPTQSVEITQNPSPVLVGPARPTASIKTSSFWVQGVNVGLEFQF